CGGGTSRFPRSPSTHSSSDQGWPMSALSEQTEIVATIRDWVDREVIPVASELEHADEFPEELVAQMRELGLIVVELSRGWTTLSGIVNGTFIASHLIRNFGTDDQKSRLLPVLAAGEIRA